MHVKKQFTECTMDQLTIQTEKHLSAFIKNFPVKKQFTECTMDQLTIQTEKHLSAFHKNFPALILPSQQTKVY
jgi:hypothetical protein